MANLTQDFAKDLAVGEKYQRFVAKILNEKYNLNIDYYTNRSEQLTIGESIQGFEVKYDRITSKTGNLFFEIESGGKPSGIYRTDNSWLWICGNYDIIYIFSKRNLQRLHKTGNYEIISNKYNSAKGFLVNQETIQEWADLIILIGEDTHNLKEDCEYYVQHDQTTSTNPA